MGRTAETTALDEFAGTPALLVVRGRGGIGRTAFLHELRRIWRERGITVLSLPVTAGEPPDDVFRAQAVVDAVRESFHEYDGPELACSVALLSRLPRNTVFTELVRLFTRLRATRPVAVLVDNVDTAPDPLRAIAAAHRAGCTVVVTCRDNGGLAPLADRVLDLGPLREAEIGELLARVALMPLDEAVVPAVRAALGPLAGHPGTVIATFESLCREDAFAEVLGHLCLRAEVALPRDHFLVRYVEGLGEVAVRIVAVAAGAARLDLDDVLGAAAAFGREVGGPGGPVDAVAPGHGLRRCGDVVDRLVAAGALACDENGSLTVPCLALATALVRGFGADRLRAVHGAIAGQLLGDMSVAADHIALAGNALLNDPALVPLLEREATRIVQVNQELAARWFRAALRHAEPADRVRLLRIVLHLLVRTAQYADLAEVVEAEVAAGVPECCRYELAAAAALVTIHIGQPLSGTVRDALADDPRALVPLRFAARWFDEHHPVRAADVAAAFSGFRVNRLPDWEHDTAEQVAIAEGRYDVVAMLRLVLGPCYGLPRTGPLGVYHRLLRDYAAGEWSRVVSGARRLELSGAPTAMHHVARLLAAEVHSSSGDVLPAAQWFGLVDENCPFAGLRAWVDLGLTGPDRGWSGYDLVRAAAENGDDVGLSCLLLRLGLVENGLGNDTGLARAAGEARRWYQRFGGASLRATELVLRGLSERDYRTAASAVTLLRRTGNAAELMRTCLAMASLCDDPAPWYAEALEFAERLGDLHTKETMRKVGVALPRARVARDDFSDVELRIIDLVRQGRTNRQIASKVRMSEKTVENYLTRLFVRTGCRSRLDLAKASLEGRLAGT
ncbi:helix-turn-helix transcriptional regulator [Lentzea nigeriaca]|uniref:helix-turn-helix transcriptional regulator n=1 Tax=Lentzea nigeriaca TaxID=1128665 RepID=UPI00195CB574|nr:helix-turn-helix transcriptional regulator [Lentzea nigeriaca]MBM7858976.1 DNA-binding CsgD family transcriptional regulator [Lentzea nigeriaca]